jgi:hypothetical protein
MWNARARVEFAGNIGLIVSTVRQRPGFQVFSSEISSSKNDRQFWRIHGALLVSAGFSGLACCILPFSMRSDSDPRFVRPWMALEKEAAYS